MRALARMIVAALVVLVVGSVSGTDAHARRSGHGSRGGVSVWLGPVWVPGWWGPHYYPSYYYPYYRTEPPMVMQQPEVNIQPAPEAEEQQIFWYYCKDPQGYYPYVKQCPSGWMKVVPSPPSPSSSTPE